MLPLLFALGWQPGRVVPALHLCMGCESTSGMGCSSPCCPVGTGLPWGPLCCLGQETMLGCVRAPVPSAYVCPAFALSLTVNTLPLTHHLLQDVLGNILFKSFFFSYTEMSFCWIERSVPLKFGFKNASLPLSLSSLEHSALNAFCFAMI